MIEESFCRSCENGSLYMSSDYEFDKFISLCKERALMNSSEDVSLAQEAWRKCSAFKQAKEVQVSYGDLLREMLLLGETGSNYPIHLQDQEVDTLILQVKELVNVWMEGVSRGNGDDRDEEGGDNGDHLGSIMNRISELYDKVSVLQLHLT